MEAIGARAYGAVVCGGQLCHLIVCAVGRPPKELRVSGIKKGIMYT